MLVQLAVLAGALFVGLAAIALVYVLGMRAKSPLVQGPLIRLQRSIINPRQMRSAGTPGAYASVIRHRGRVSGRQYETPVGAVAAGDGFVIGLVYGVAYELVPERAGERVRDHRPRGAGVRGRSPRDRPDAGG